VVMSLAQGETSISTTALRHSHSSTVRTGLPVRVCITKANDVHEALSSDIEIRATFTLD
jgi:hypothetical protein